MNIMMFLPNLAGGGAERVALTLAESFAKRGHKVSFVLVRGEGQLLKDCLDQFETITLNLGSIWKAIPALRKAIKTRQPDIVLSFMPIANAVASLAKPLFWKKTKVIATEHSSASLTFAKSSKFRTLAQRTLVRLSYNRSDHVVAVSDGVKNQLSGVVRNERKISLIYNPIDVKSILEKARTPPLDAISDLDTSTPLIVSVGRLVPQKDFGTLLSALSLVSKETDVRCLIFGDDVLRDELQRRIFELDLHTVVTLAGYTENPWYWMKKADVFALSSVNEGFGLVLVEALAMGTQVVSTDCPSGPSEILMGGKFGRLVAPQSPQHLAAALLCALKEPSDGSQGMLRALDFDIEKISELYLQLFSEAENAEQQ